MIKKELPKDWSLVPITEIGKIETGTTPSKAISEYYGTEYPFYKPSDLEAGINVHQSIDGLSKIGIDKARFIPEFTTLVTCIGATIGKTGYIKKGGGFNQQINAIVPNEKSNPKFIYYQAISLGFQKQIKSSASATTLPLLNKSKFQLLTMVTCSLETQQAIVCKIEELFGDIDKGIEDLKIAQQQLKTYRQSVLKWAFEGKLTNENVKEVELPKGWGKLKIKDICEIKGGKNQSKVINPNGKYPIYGSSGIFGYANEYICDENTTILGRKGNINNPLYVTTKFWNVDTAFGLCVNDKYDSKLLFYFCLGFNFKKLDKSTTIPSLAKSDILSIDIQVPPLKEQYLIVQEIENRLSVADKMEESINESLKQAEALRQSILKKAFSGELI